MKSEVVFIRLREYYSAGLKVVVWKIRDENKRIVGYLIEKYL